MTNDRPSLHVLHVRATDLEPVHARQLYRDACAALRGGARVLIIDLAAVSFIDSLGVAAIAAVVEEAPASAVVVLAGLKPYVTRVIHMTRLHEVIDVYANVDAATRALAA